MNLGHSSNCNTKSWCWEPGGRGVWALAVSESLLGFDSMGYGALSNKYRVRSARPHCAPGLRPWIRAALTGGHLPLPGIATSRT